MAKSKKFGTFSGVFTPSILTILGVIMYLRFPSIIGQAGLINTIGIIVIAHIISVTTSLSVASLSTDKPVQNGGTYFMISRSLGLPIGGTLGLALFVGLSFSVSLYLIGFAESFLQYWGLANNIANIRITGTIVLISVTTITFISTSLAIKSQYFIMGAIVLSLLSIFLGHHEFAPTKINMTPLATSAPFMVLFGIFFPAVTGFEAGVSMSGDLKNPSKSLPIGAMLAVGVGFIVYIGLAFFYAFTVSSDALVNDPEILFKISLVPGLVIAGIWGATLSSALGSILGAPRILQAIAMDKIAPKALAKGTGATNEPRNALLLAFIIAEAGILIGELDVIARIVSMFFITTYAFLNLASAIESWSSSDFRPAFKIPKFVSILGALSAFFVMILLDFIALAGATIVLGLLYFFLQRKELILESGDAWSSFWTNLAKKALLKLSIQKVDKRNWRPNVLLFSGGEQARPHLIEMGLSLTGKLGALTDFDLVINHHETNIKYENFNKGSNKKNNYFIRQFASKSVEEGIKTVTSVYGFNGFEPNTILMGWTRDNKNVNFLTNVLHDLKTKNLNAIFLDYDKTVGFGKKQSIDIWWNGKGRVLNFALSILKFLLSDAKWRDAQIRILVINNNSFVTDILYRNTLEILTDKRIKAEIKIISNDFGTRTKESIINSESENADLILLGLSQKNEAYTPEYVSTISKISQIPASILFLSPSEEFESVDLVDIPGKKEAIIPESIQKTDLPPIPDIENSVVKSKLTKLETNLQSITNTLVEKALFRTINNELTILKGIIEFAKVNYNKLEWEINEFGKHEFSKIVIRNHQIFLRNINQIIKNKNTEIIHEAQKLLNAGISEFSTQMGNYLYETAEHMMVSYTITKKQKETSYKINYKKQIEYYLNAELLPEIVKHLNELEEISVKLFTDMRNAIFSIHDDYEKFLITDLESKTKSVLNISNKITELEGIEQKLKNHETNCNKLILTSIRKIVISIANDLLNPQSIKRMHVKVKRKQIKYEEYFISYADNWKTGIELINNTLYLDTLVLSEQKIVNNIMQKGNERITEHVREMALAPIAKLITNIEEAAKSSTPDIKPPVFPEKIQIQNIFNESYNKVAEVIDELPDEILLPETLYVNSNFVAFKNQIPLNVNTKKNASYYIDNMFYEPFYREIAQLETTINQACIECQESNSMLQFRLNNIDKDSFAGEKDKDQHVIFYHKLITDVTKEQIKLEEAIINIHNKAIGFIQDAFSNLFYHAIFESKKKISSQKREIKNKKFSENISKKVKLLKTKTNKSIARLLNSASSGIILSKKYLSEDKLVHTQINEILDVIDNITPHKKVHQKIPVFYRSLMSSSSKISDDFWVTREKELNQIKLALQRHKNGISGAILINGVHGSGKSTLSRFAAYHLIKKTNIFWIDTPKDGSINTKDLLKEFRLKILNINSIDGIFDNISPESIVVINDLEMWWERSNKGMQVMNRIIELIEKYSKKVFFILNCNTYSYRIIKELVPLQEHLLSIIECGNFNASQLQQLIMSRHKSSGIKLKYNGKLEEDISPLSLSLLFNSYFNFSKGIPGVAMNAWKANIIDANSDIITIKKPSISGVDILQSLESDMLIIIALFIQHKAMNIQKLSRITGYDVDISKQLINKLINMGLAVPKGNTSFTLGRNIEPFLVEVCANKGLI